MTASTQKEASPDDVLFSVDGAIATITMNRPALLNAGNESLLSGIRDSLRAAADDPAVRAVVLTGAGRGFCSGADLTIDGWGPADATEGERIGWILREHWNPTARAISHFPKPTVAMVNGVAAGGGVGLALACDLAIAAQSATFVQVFGPQLAVIPDVGSTWHLPRLLGPARARGLAMLGDRLAAHTAADWGLIWEVVPDDALADRVRSVAERLAALDSDVAREIPEAIRRSGEHSFEEQLAYEAAANTRLGDGPGIVEGVAAFREGRPPRFS